MRFIIGVVLLLVVVGFFSGLGKHSPSSTSRATAAAPVEVAPYADRLSESMQALSDFDAASLSSSVETIGLAVALFNVWAQLIEEGNGMTMSDETAAMRREFADALKRAQRTALPLLRDKYGPALRELLWEDDITARTIGSGFRTIDLVGALFAANRNIKASNDSLYPALMRLRFTRAQYRWFSGADEYTYFELSPPPDDGIAVFADNGTFRTIQ